MASTSCFLSHHSVPSTAGTKILSPSRRAAAAAAASAPAVRPTRTAFWAQKQQAGSDDEIDSGAAASRRLAMTALVGAAAIGISHSMNLTWPMAFGGFDTDAVATANILETSTPVVDGKQYYCISVLTRTADGNEGGKHQLITAAVSNGKLYICKAQAGDKRWFKGARKFVESTANSFKVA